MKIKTKLIFLFLMVTSLCSCKNNEFYLYYSYEGSVEVYCWKKDLFWYAGLLPATSRLKRPEEVKWLQDNLPCPIYKMRGILDTIVEEEKKKNTYLCIVSVPPKLEELYHEVDRGETCLWLREQLNLGPIA